MKLLHYLEIQNFKRFGDSERIELDHPAVLIGPNNCGKTTAIQAIALWSQAVRAWHASKGKAPPRQRTSTSLNRLNIVAVPVQRTRYFWHNAAVRTGNTDIPLRITVGILHDYRVEAVTMAFRNQGEDLVYCTPDESTLARPELVAAAATLNVELLYPMSGLETEEPILQRGRIDVLLGQGQTAQVLRNLCLLVYQANPDDWKRIAEWMERLFNVTFSDPKETSRGSIDLFYRQDSVREPLDIAVAGRGLQQMLLLFAYLYSHRRSVILIDEPDAHLEILRQKQVYVLLRELATENESQVILVTHSEVILDEALDHNLTLLLAGRADDVAAKASIRNALKHYGAEHYIRARERGYVLYVEGGTDIEILRALANRIGHRRRGRMGRTDQLVLRGGQLSGHQPGFRAGPRRGRLRRHTATAFSRTARHGAGADRTGDPGQRWQGAPGLHRRRTHHPLLAAVRVRKLRRYARDAGRVRQELLPGDPVVRWIPRPRSTRPWTPRSWNASLLAANKTSNCGRRRTTLPVGCCGRHAPSASSSARSPRNSFAVSRSGSDTPCCCARANSIGSWNFFP